MSSKPTGAGSSALLNSPTARREAVKVTLIGAALDLALGLLKIAVGLIANSFALVSDGIHSLSDLLTDGFVLAMARIAHEEPDAEHPYGHRRFETLGTIAIAAALFVVAGVICYDSLRRLWLGEEAVVPGALALAAAALSIIGKEWIYRYTKAVALRLRSSMLLANAWHSRTDALSSIAVLIGLIGALLGFPWMDLVAAIAVGLMIAKIAWNLLAGSLRELVDTALPAEHVRAIREHILGLTGIDGVHSLRSRQHAGQTFLDIHVQVDSKISVSEGHYLGDRIIRSLKATFPDVTDVLIHIDPELDLDATSARLPLRREVTALLLDRWTGLITREDIEKLTLHYLNEKVQVEVILRSIDTDDELREKLKKKAEELDWLESLKIYKAI